MDVNKSNTLKVCMGYSRDILSQYICEEAQENSNMIDLKLKDIQYKKKIIKLQKTIEKNSQKQEKALAINDMDSYIKLSQNDLHMHNRLRKICKKQEVIINKLLKQL